MVNFHIDDSLVYEILKFVDSSPDTVTTLREIVDNTPLTDYNSGNTVVSELCSRGLLSGRAHDGIITVTFDSHGCGKLFLDNYRHVSYLTSKEKWKERLWSYALGVLTGVTVAAIVFYFGFS